MIRAAITMFVLSATATAVDAAPLVTVRASSQHAQKDSPTRFHPFNLLDNDPATIWCEGAEGLGERESVQVFFKKQQRIDRIVIGPAQASGRRVEVVRISDGLYSIDVTLADKYVTSRLATPMKSERFEISIRRVGPATGSEEVGSDVACLAEVLLYQKKKLFGGRGKPGKISVDAKQEPILGIWNGEPFGAPETFLTFALDGTWQWRFQPLDGSRGKKLKGQYRFRGNRLLMRKGAAGRWADVGFRQRLVELDPDDIGGPAAAYSIVTVNAVIDKALAGEYNNASFE